MEAMISNLVNRFERGSLTRRELVPGPRDAHRGGADPEDNLDAGFHIKDPEGISVQIVGV
jgi:hypothetical protein